MRSPILLVMRSPILLVMRSSILLVMRSPILLVMWSPVLLVFHPKNDFEKYCTLNPTSNPTVSVYHRKCSKTRTRLGTSSVEECSNSQQWAEIVSNSRQQSVRASDSQSTMFRPKNATLIVARCVFLCCPLYSQSRPVQSKHCCTAKQATKSILIVWPRAPTADCKTSTARTARWK